MQYLSKKKTYIILLIFSSFLFNSCAIFQKNKNVLPDNQYINCHLQNVQLALSGDKKIDREKKKKQLKYTENRRTILFFFDELSKESEDDNDLLQHFEPDATIEYDSINIKKSSQFLEYLDYVAMHTNEEPLVFDKNQCGGKRNHRIYLEAPNQKKKIIWSFAFSKKHKINYFKETLEYY